MHLNLFICLTLPKCCKDLKPTKVLGGNVLNLQKLMVKDCKLWRDPKWSDLNWDSKKNTSEHWIFKSWTCSNPGSGTCIAAEDEFLRKSSIFNWHWTLVSALHSHLASIWGQILEAKVHTRKRPPMSLIFQTVAILEPKRWEIISIEVVLAFNRVFSSKNSSHHYYVKLDWQDSRISRGNGKWICGKIPAGNEVREIAGKIDQLWSKLVQNLFKYGLKAG